MRRIHFIQPGIVALILAGLILTEVRADTAPAIVQTLDCRPDRGNHERFGYVTGPMAYIDRVYNEDLEISFWNQPQALTFSLAKNDVWDRRYFGDTKKLITLEDVRRVCFGGEMGPARNLGLPDTPQVLYAAYDFPCPKPVGQIIIRCGELVERALPSK